MPETRLTDKRIFVAGDRGMVGSAVIRALDRAGLSHNILTAERNALDLCDQGSVDGFFAHKRPQIVVFAAGKVGGIHANRTYPAEFLATNALMASLAVDAAYRHGVERFLYLGSTCIYPRDTPQPIRETALLTGPLESTNEAYALAKITGLKLCQYYRQQYGVLFHSAMPTNLYGPGDNYHPENAHVLPALLHRFHVARRDRVDEVVLWGTGKPRREFLHVDDLAGALLHLLKLDDVPDWVNVGTGQDVTIGELADCIADTVGYTGRISYDPSKPDGTPVKCTDPSLMRSLGWTASISLRDGLRNTYESYLAELSRGTIRV